MRKLTSGRGYGLNDLVPPGDKSRRGGFEQGTPPGIQSDNIQGIVKKPYSCLTLELDSARDDFQLDIVGTLIYIVRGLTVSTETLDANVNIEIKYNDPKNDPVPFVPGQSIGGMPFDRLYISNTAQADKSITLLIITDSEKNRVDVE